MTQFTSAICGGKVEDRAVDIGYAMLTLLQDIPEEGILITRRGGWIVREGRTATRREVKTHLVGRESSKN